MTREWVIYALVDPRDNCARYVGKTVDLTRRVKNHLADKSANRKAHWLRSLVAAGHAPSVIVLERGTGAWDVSERHWIAWYRADGCDLTNLTPGGDGVSEMAPETRERIAATRRALWQDP